MKRGCFGGQAGSREPPEGSKGPGGGSSRKGELDVRKTPWCFAAGAGAARGLAQLCCQLSEITARSWIKQRVPGGRQAGNGSRESAPRARRYPPSARRAGKQTRGSPDAAQPGRPHGSGSGRPAAPLHTPPRGEAAAPGAEGGPGPALCSPSGLALTSRTSCRHSSTARLLAQLCLEHSRTTSSRHTASSDSFHPPPEPPPPPRAPRGPEAPGAAPCAGCPAAFKPGPACRPAAGGTASAGRAASASSRRTAGPGQRLRTRPHGAILDPPPPARPPRRTHAVCKAARRLTSPRRTPPLGAGGGRGDARPRPLVNQRPLSATPPRDHPCGVWAPFWAGVPLGHGFLRGPS